MTLEPICTALSLVLPPIARTPLGCHRPLVVHDPMQLDIQLTFKQFTDLQPRDVDPEQALAAYNAYKRDYLVTQIPRFFSAFRNMAWYGWRAGDGGPQPAWPPLTVGPTAGRALSFRLMSYRFVERYHPTHRMATEEALRAAAKEGFDVFKAEWESGVLANLSLDETAATAAAPAVEDTPAALPPVKPAKEEDKEDIEKMAVHTEAASDTANAEPGELQDDAANVLGGYDVANRTHRFHCSAIGGKGCAHIPGRRCSVWAGRRARDGARWVADHAPLWRDPRGAGQDRALQDSPAHHQARGPGGPVQPARRIPAARDGRAEGVPRLPPHGLCVLRARDGCEPRRQCPGGLQGASGGPVCG